MPTTSVQETPLHTEIHRRVSIQPHPRNRMYCVTTLRGGCMSSFQTIDELVDHLINKYGSKYHLYVKCTRYVLFTLHSLSKELRLEVPMNATFIGTSSSNTLLYKCSVNQPLNEINFSIFFICNFLFVVILF